MCTRSTKKTRQQKHANLYTTQVITWRARDILTKAKYIESSTFLELHKTNLELSCHIQDPDIGYLSLW